jgi:hypothetical protein
MDRVRHGDRNVNAAVDLQELIVPDSMLNYARLGALILYGAVVSTLATRTLRELD